MYRRPRAHFAAHLMIKVLPSERPGGPG